MTYLSNWPLPAVCSDGCTSRNISVTIKGSTHFPCHFECYFYILYHIQPRYPVQASPGPLTQLHTNAVSEALALPSWPYTTYITDTVYREKATWSHRYWDHPGVPQKSVLEPLLFLINNLPISNTSEARLLADDWSTGKPNPSRTNQTLH